MLMKSMDVNLTTSFALGAPWNVRMNVFYLIQQLLKFNASDDRLVMLVKKELVESKKALVLLRWEMGLCLFILTNRHYSACFPAARASARFWRRSKLLPTATMGTTSR